MSAVKKVRLDVLLVERGLVESRTLGQRLIMEGQILVNDQVVSKVGTPIPVDAVIEVRARPRFVSRGGEKLVAALEAFLIRPQGWICADVGASTGGFTDCLLQACAARVYAIDVGYGQLAWSLRRDPRVVVMERMNARYVEQLPEAVDLVTIDASFISLKLLLPVVMRWLKPDGRVVALVKPQFEAGREDVGRGGVVRDPEIHRRVLREVIGWAQEGGFALRGLIRSPLLGPAGNMEFLLWLAGQDQPTDTDAEALISACVPTAPEH